MHPILAHRQRLALYLAAWIPIAAMLTGLLVFSGRLPWGSAAVFAAPMTILYSFLCLSAWYLCRAFPVGRTGFPRLFAVFGAAALVSSGFWILIGRAWAGSLSPLPVFAPLWASYSAHAPLLFVVGVLLFFLAVTVHYLMGIFESSRDAERRALEMNVLAREAELKALKAQVDPHFLFNSLNSISALTTIDPAASRSMCQLLADFLRKSLDAGAKHMIRLEEELALVSSYLEIEKVRLGSRLTISVEADDACRACLVPPLVLQPLAENAVRHGIAQRVDGGSIRLAAERRGSLLEIRVINPVDSDPPPLRRNGIGLANVRGRLETLFGPEARLDTHRGREWFEVSILLPAMDKARDEPALFAKGHD